MPAGTTWARATPSARSGSTRSRTTCWPPASTIALERREAPLADAARTSALRACSSGYVAELQELLEQVAGRRPAARDRPRHLACPRTWAAALRAAGAAVAATDAVIDGAVENAFCAVRPPGHHATRDQAMGFCFFNNVAIAARHALDVRGLERVAIVDFDVHHGNGTEDILAGDERVLMVEHLPAPALSVQRRACRRATNMLNVPVPPYTEGLEIRELIEEKWLPRLEAFKPQMIFICAGFDAHRDDDLGQLGLVEADYDWITRRIKDVADRHAEGAHRVAASKAATTSARWRAAWPRICGCWPALSRLTRPTLTDRCVSA